MQVDVSNFYGSIYTHAVDWAMRSKSVAKKGKKDRSLASLVDRYLQLCNDNQTAGIAIGPDTSRILSEVMLAAVDEQAQKAMPSIVRSAVRMIDDVTYFAPDDSAAAEFLHTYSAALAGFELQLNESKTQRVEGIQLPERTWKTRVSNLANRLRNATDERARFGIAEELLHLHQETGGYVFNYFFASLEPKVAIASWDALSLLLPIAMRLDPITTSQNHRFTVAAHEAAQVKGRTKLSDDLHEFALQACALQHEYEAAITLNTLHDLGAKLDGQLVRKAIDLESDLLDLLILEAARATGRHKRAAAELEARARASDAFESGHWLLAYEVQRNDAPHQRSQQMKQGTWSVLANAHVSFMRQRINTRSTDYHRRLRETAQRSAYAHAR